MEQYHHRLSDQAYPLARGPMWAKCDMLATVSLARLDRIKTRVAGKQGYIVFQIPIADNMQAIQAGMRHALGLMD